MIPLKLSLKNFLCYGEGLPTLDLAGIHVACLCGQNGHGKSALLDAMTWALWGKARGKAQDELIRFGYDDMLVELEFLARDTCYRVARRHSSGTGRRRQGASDLQFQISGGNGFHPITGNSIRETQAKIDQATGMDYETFINSAFLLQGRADEFTNKTPGDRKEILAKIMGLELYDRLEDAARELARERRAHAEVIGNDLERMRTEVSRVDGYQSELDDLKLAFAEVAGQLDTSKQAVETLKLRVEDLRRQRAELEEAERRVPAVEEEISRLEKEIESRRGRMSGYQTLVDQREEIESRFRQLEGLRSRHVELERSRDQHDSIAREKADLEGKVAAARARLEERAGSLKKRIDNELRPLADAAPHIVEKLEEARAHLAGLALEARSISQRQGRLDDLNLQIGQYEVTERQLMAEGQDLRSKLELIESSDQGALCPLCGAQLGSRERQDLLASYRSQIEEKRDLYRSNQTSLKAAREEKGDLELELPRLKKDLEGRRDEANKAVILLERQRGDSENATKEQDQLGQEVVQVTLAIEAGAYADEEQVKLSELDARLEGLDYDREAHQRLSEWVQELQPSEERHRHLAEALERLPQETQSLTLAEDIYRGRQAELLELQSRTAEMGSQLLELPQWETRLLAAERGYRELEARHQELFRRQVESESRLENLRKIERQLDEKQAALTSSLEEQDIYEELRRAFSKGGVQAMLIETVLPSIEEEANRLLGRMTDNRMNLKLETQRERRSGRGDPIETLEIVISDELGPRSYELFSGGEAFRINLALRIALSKVLAHRKGAPLPTLFIDEGFGTQDAAGRERILDVISAIEGDFEKIIVITHMEELKEAFPVRIEVEKGEGGSRFSITYA